MDAPVESEHKYDALAPTKHSKGLKFDRNAKILTASLAVILLCIIIIVATVLATVGTDLAKQDVLTAALTTEKANTELKDVKNATDICRALNNGSKCYYPMSMYSSDCKAISCQQYTVSLTSVDQITFMDNVHAITDTDGFPCSTESYCYKGVCVTIKNEALQSKTRNLFSYKHPGGLVSRLFSDPVTCVHVDFKGDVMSQFLSLTKNDKCDTVVNVAVQLRVMSCLDPVPSAVAVACSSSRFPFAYKKMANSCPGGQELNFEAYAKKACSKCTVGKCSIIGCSATCDDGVKLVADRPYACSAASSSGYCFHGKCLPTV